VRADTLSRVAARLGEGPLWIPEESAVAWVDIVVGRVTLTALDGTELWTTRLDEQVGAICQGSDGSILAATISGLRSTSTGELRAAMPPQTAGLRMNDGKVDTQGRFVGGTTCIDDPVTGSASLWSLTERGAVELVSGVTISNGLCWSADGTTMYYVDTPTQQIDAFDYDPATGQVDRRRAVAFVEPSLGAPDGLTIDSEGGLWVALWSGSRVCRFHQGKLGAVIEVPTPYVTSVTFVGPSLDSLVITTAAQPFGATRAPGAGDLYIVEPGVRGLATTHRFGSSTPGD
jgi:sugar lactone lactonase YvrE